MRGIDTSWLNSAVKAVQDGLANKLVKDNITVYRVKNVIRIDLKETDNGKNIENTSNQ